MQADQHVGYVERYVAVFEGPYLTIARPKILENPEICQEFGTADELLCFDPQ
jgi:hypothetical protein